MKHIEAQPFSYRFDSASTALIMIDMSRTQGASAERSSDSGGIVAALHLRALNV